MKVSELSRTTGVSVATIKYYLREGLLPVGETAGAPNQADYGPEHVHRLHLIRTLLHVGGLSIAVARETIAAIEDPEVSEHRMFAVAHDALPGRSDPAPPDDEVLRARRDVDDYLAELDWESTPDTPARAMLADALVALRRLGRDVGPEVFAPYADIADGLAARELATLDGAAPRAELVESVVVGTVVFEAALVALRRLAQANHSSRMFD